jgi:hypothetical protein
MMEQRAPRIEVAAGKRFGVDVLGSIQDGFGLRA